MNFRRASVITALLSVAALSAFGSTVTYPSSLSTVIDSGGDSGTELAFFWSASRGDSVTETFTGTGLASIDSLSLSFGIDDSLNSGNEVDWNVLVNGTSVGSWVWTEADGSGTLNQSYSFAPIIGSGTYTLTMAVTNEVPGGGGSIGILIPGTATLSSSTDSVPEPVSSILLGTGLVALGIRKTFKRS